MTNTVNKGIIDCGCPDNIMGRSWYNIFKDSLILNKNGTDSIQTRKDLQQFKFGPSNIFTSTEKVIIPITLGKLETEIEVSIVNCEIPLLISRKQLETWKVTQNNSKCELVVGITGETITLDKLESGHFALDLGCDDTEAIFETCFFGLNTQKKPEAYQSIKKVHRSLGHPLSDKLISLYKNKGSLTPKVEKTIKKVCDQCNICKKRFRARSRPKVGLPKSTSVNQKVSIDLKNVSTLIDKKTDKRYVLYLNDEFSKFIRGTVIKNKEKERIIEAILADSRIFGFPRGGYHGDIGMVLAN